MSEYIQVKIPLALYKAVEEIVLQTEDYKSQSEIVCHVLREFAPGNSGRDTYSAAEQKEIENRLKDLGYLG